MDIGNLFHSYATQFGFSKNVFVGSSIIDMYTKYKNVGDSGDIYQREPNEVTTNALTFGLALQGRVLKAIEVFKAKKPNKVILIFIYQLAPMLNSSKKVYNPLTI